MDITNINGYTINNLNQINIVLGKNGCGKSSMLRDLEAGFGSYPNSGKSRYVTPERGGTLKYAAGVEENMVRDTGWIAGQRRRNQAENFRQQSVAQYRTLETLVLRGIDKDRSKPGFDLYVKRINSLLDNIEIRVEGATFKIYKLGSNSEIQADNISSGESELISLGIECLIFAEESIAGKENILFLDEPDVHLHPDLQVRFMHFLQELVLERSFRVILATHSTAILGAIGSYSNAHLALMVSGQKEISFFQISEAYEKILPIFGAHPLSNLFNALPLLLVEGDDDERIWQQAIRSSDHTIKLYPCSVDGLDNLNDFEQKTQMIIKAVYEDARGYSLRDRDGSQGEIDDLPSVIRLKLSCRNAENLLLTDDSLNKLGISWEQLKINIQNWLQEKPAHPHFEIMKRFAEEGFDRKNYDVKEIRNDLMYLVGSSKQWEVVVGQAIAQLSWNDASSFNKEGKLATFLGEKVVKKLLPKKSR